MAWRVLSSMARERETRASKAARVYRWAILAGWTEEHAASWAAFLVGLRLVHGPRVLTPWT